MVFDPITVALITALLSAFVSFVSLGFSSKSQAKLAQLQSNLSTKEKITDEERSLLYKQLSEFYDPILVLLEVNKDIFLRLGPKSSIRHDIEILPEEVHEIWIKLLNDVILPNNEKICDILTTNLHLISAGDNIEHYIKFVTHAYVYRVFREKPTAAYKFFQFPKGLEEHVRRQRNDLYKQLEGIKMR